MNCKVSHQLYVNKSLSLWNNFHSSRLPGRIFVCSDNFLVMQTKHSMLVRNKACRQYLNIPVFVGEPSEYSILDILLGRTIYVIKTLQLPSPAKSCSRVLVATYYQLVIIHKNCRPAPPLPTHVTRHPCSDQQHQTFYPLNWDETEVRMGMELASVPQQWAITAVTAALQAPICHHTNSRAADLISSLWLEALGSTLLTLWGIEEGLRMFQL